MSTHLNSIYYFIFKQALLTIEESSFLYKSRPSLSFSFSTTTMNFGHAMTQTEPCEIEYLKKAQES